jgi:HEAT repeat protein
LLEDTPDEKRPPSGRLLDPDEVPDDPSTPGLVEKLKSKNAAERLEAVNVLAKLGKGAKSAARALCTLIVIDPAKEVRQAALDAIEKIEPSLAEPLTTLLVDTSVQNAALATRKIGGMGRAGVPAIPVLIWRARSRLGKGGDFCEEIIRALVQLGPADRDALRAIINHVQSPVTEVGIPGSSERERMVALEALGLSTVAKSDYRKEIVGFLVKTLAQYEPQTADRRGRIGRGPLHDTDAPLLIVIGSIAEYGPDSKDAVPVLKRLKLDRNIKVRQGAVAALEKIDKPE